MERAVIIVAAGRGSRAGGGVPKQWRAVAGKPVARWTLEAFAGLGRLLMMIHDDDRALAQEVAAGLDVTLLPGGESRDASVRAGLEALAADPPDTVLIHDVARPCVSRALVAAVLSGLERSPGAAPGLAVSDALWTGESGQVTGTRERAGLFRAQTPQGFHFSAILAAHRGHAGGAADDVAVARAAGLDVAIVPGEADNIKITGPEDFARAARILETPLDIRLGNGFDVHRFGPGDAVTLCGVPVPHERGLAGHSDADVGLHAVTDALYGALAEGDIGRHFPPTDPQWKGADSALFLQHACTMAREAGFAIGNVDCTLICERPRIGPHAPAMIARMAEIMALEPQRISVKATTSERLGFTGREEGIAALATATLVRA